MRHGRSDYAPIQDPREDGIPDDEPVFLLRGQDRHAPATLRYWADRVEQAGGDPSLAAGAREQAERMQAWQDSRGAKEPNLPDEATA